MIFINFRKWTSWSNSMLIWERIYKNGYKWTPFIMAKRRYKV